MKKKVLLLVLDGFGIGEESPGNAIFSAKTPCIDSLMKQDYGLLNASGESVGLTDGSMGGSEVGHFTMGAGRIVPQFSLAINNSIEDGSFSSNEALRSAFDHALETGTTLHLMGMISDKGVHSHIDHLLALLDEAKKTGLKKVFVHAIADGRDVKERSVARFIDCIQKKIDEIGLGSIATLVGRYYAMDRDNNWDRTKVSYQLMTRLEGDFYESIDEGISNYYESNDDVTDYYFPAQVYDKSGAVQTGDAVIFFNYRTDRTRQITSAFVDKNFNALERNIEEVAFVCMGPYSDQAPVAYMMPEVKNNLSKWLSRNEVRQFRCAEKEKYAHVTFFFNSQHEEPYPLEERELIDSHKLMSFAERPEMSASEITKLLVEKMQNGEHQVIIANYANCDLVGHSGDFEATVKAVEVVDESLKALLATAKDQGYSVMITGDHGNADEMKYPDGSQKPSHSMNPVPLFIIESGKETVSVKNGGLSDIAPTLLDLIDLEAPEEMTGTSLINR
jgi:2,3-bisphosphoglycerate-independent phosphoglycerate mutase